jgi:hypothetical protein
VAVAFALWAVPALLDPRLLDFGLAYRAGEEAWASGRPEQLKTWMGTPLLAVSMALVSRLVRPPVGMRLLTAVNLGLTLALVVLVWRALRPLLPRLPWWSSLALATVSSPVISTVFYKQFNLIALALAVAGFAAVGRGRSAVGGGLIAVSLCLKPLLVLLPFALLSRRDTRRAGVWCLATAAVLMALAQAALAARAHSLEPLSPLAFFSNFGAKAEPWIFHPDNFSPLGLVYRSNATGATDDRGFQRAALGLGILLLVAAADHALRGRPGASWEAFAFCCLLSPMLSPVAWSHYQVLLLPMLLVLWVRFLRHGAHWTRWAGLALAYALAQLVQQPLGSVPGGVLQALTGREESYVALTRVLAVAAFAQYVLLGTALLSFSEERATS